MENGLGRTGYLLLTTIMLMFAMLGLGTAYLGFQEGSALFFELGISLAVVAVLGQFGFAALAPLFAEPRQKKVKAAKAEAPQTRAVEIPPVPADVPIAGSPNYEFNDAQPAARAAPESMVLPQAFESAVAFDSKDPAAWPERGAKGDSAWTNNMNHDRKTKAMVSEAQHRRELAERYTRKTPLVRAAMQDPPTRVAERAPPGSKPGAIRGATVGQCGRCHTMVVAPNTRPMRLKCPECAKVTLLN